MVADANSWIKIALKRPLIDCQCLCERKDDLICDVYSQHYWEACQDPGPLTECCKLLTSAIRRVQSKCQDPEWLPRQQTTWTVERHDLAMDPCPSVKKTSAPIVLYQEKVSICVVFVPQSQLCFAVITQTFSRTGNWEVSCLEVPPLCAMGPFFMINWRILGWNEGVVHFQGIAQCFGCGGARSNRQTRLEVWNMLMRNCRRIRATKESTRLVKVPRCCTERSQ